MIKVKWNHPNPEMTDCIRGKIEPGTHPAHFFYKLLEAGVIYYEFDFSEATDEEKSIWKEADKIKKMVLNLYYGKSLEVNFIPIYVKESEEIPMAAHKAWIELMRIDPKVIKTFVRKECYYIHKIK